eukprot:TRINITY_DN2771_c0_g3_i2.p1 TRINITY_DN2771_c0_g3~~TRINITY_DN2771_c0_g3_i2.p1  ORF type:complete len:179 (-),score=38.86 TRINITY_DN2771_c0_g3_i2:163-699(-)
MKSALLIALVFACFAAVALSQDDGYVSLPPGTYAQQGENPGTLVVREDGQGGELRFLGVGAPGACAVGGIYEPLAFHHHSGLLHLVIPDLIIHDLTLNVLELVSVHADAAVLDAVVDVLTYESGLVGIHGTIALDLYASVLPLLHLIGLHGLLDAHISLVIPLSLNILGVGHDVPFVC